MLGRENLISREEVERLQELRGTYGIKAPAPICAGSGLPRPDSRRGRSGQGDDADLSDGSGAGRDRVAARAGLVDAHRRRRRRGDESR